jgi:hypothetical protein
LKALSLDEKVIVANAINAYTNFGDASTPAVQLANAINALPGYLNKLSTTALSASTNPVEDLCTEIKAKITDIPTTGGGDKIIKIIFNTYLKHPTNNDTTWQNIKDFFNLLIREDIKQYILDFITPKIKTSLQLTGHVALPRKWLMPLYPDPLPTNPVPPFNAVALEPIPLDAIPANQTLEPRASFQFSKVDINIDSQTGANIHADFTISATTPVMLGKTGLIIETFTELKLDLRADKNIPEINADGREASFKGIYLKHCNVRLPKKWNSTNFTAPNIIAENLIIGNESGVSGKIGIQGVNKEVFIPFAISTVAQFADDIQNKLITVTGDDVTIIINLELIENLDMYYRDLANHYYKRDATGAWLSLSPGKIEFIPFAVSNVAQLANIANSTDIKIIGDVSTNVIKYVVDNTQDIYYKDTANHIYKRDTAGTFSTAVYNVSLPPSSILDFSIGGGVHITFDSFFIELHQNQVTSSSVIGSIYGGIFAYPLKIEVDFDNGFLIKAFTAKGMPLLDNNNIRITLDGLLLGKSDEIWKLGFAAGFIAKKEIPALGKLFPAKFNINNFYMQSDANNIKFDIEADWKNGVKISGNDSQGLKAYIPINKNEEGSNSLFNLKAIQLNAFNKDGFNLETILVNPSLKISIVKAEAEGLGALLKVKQDEQATNNNLHPYNIDVKMVGPKGIAISIDKNPIKGAGYLFFDSENGIYKGGLILKLNKFTLSAFAIIHTKMPDGEKGFALLISVSADGFTPIALPFGIFLTGIGGILGLHHTFDSEYIRNGIKNDVLGQLLFPTIALEKNQGSILQFIDTFDKTFPIKRNQFIVGPMFKLQWPASTKICSLTVGIFIEFSEPFRILLIGKLKVLAHETVEDLFKVQVGFVGIIDFNQKYFSFDASIYDSKIAKFMKLSGDIAVRVFWGEHPDMLLTIGGFHPAYNAPTNLKLPASIQRITIALAGNPNDKSPISLTLEVYTAITSNTFQFGAKLAMLLDVSGFQIKGLCGVDTLFQFNPFQFQAHVYAMLAVFCKNKELFALGMDFTLQGPGPWHAKGFAEFKFFGFTTTANFEKIWGEASQTILPEIAIKPLLVQELNKQESWSGLLPTNADTYVRFKPYSGAAILVDPNGNLQITQKIVPLGISIEKFGAQMPSDGAKFEITSISTVIGTVFTPQNFSYVKENFAPAQFIKMTDDDKLKAASFEYLKAGVVMHSSTWGTDVSGFETKEIEYEAILIDYNEAPVKLSNINAKNALHYGLIKGGIISENAISIKQKTQSIKPLLNVRQEKYQLYSKDTLSPMLDPVAFTNPIPDSDSLAEALDFKNKYGEMNAGYITSKFITI